MELSPSGRTARNMIRLSSAIDYLWLAIGVVW